MAVYTRVSLAEAAELFALYALPAPERLTEIGAGIENSNYFVQAGADAGGLPRKWVLTLFENLAASELPYFLQLLVWLKTQGLPVAAPLADRHGQHLQSLHGKPAILVPCLAGASVLEPTPFECQQVALTLARLHQVAPGVPVHRTAPRNLAWLQAAQARLDADLKAPQRRLLADEIQYQQQQAPQLARCPQGVVHGDLFRDNVLFFATGDEKRLSGLIDFYHACDDVLLLDLAIVANDWATDGWGVMDSPRLSALLQAYQSVRPWTAPEHEAWPVLQRLAALKFWVSRLLSRQGHSYQQLSTAGDQTKNPDEFRALLETLRG